MRPQFIPVETGLYVSWCWLRAGSQTVGDDQVKQVVKNLSVMRTEESDRALKILMETGMGQSEATRWALKIAANILEFGWLAGFENRGKIPDMRVQYRVKKDS